MYGPEFEKKVDEIVTRYPQPRAALLPVLWEVQQSNGWVDGKSEEWSEGVAVEGRPSVQVHLGEVTKKHRDAAFQIQLRYNVPAGGGKMSLRIYDARGQLVKTLVSGHAAAGEHTARWDGLDGRGRTVASGIYFYRLKAGDFAQTSKMVLTK